MEDAQQFIKKIISKKYKNINLKNAEYLADKTISFLVDHTITKKDIVHTCDVLKKEINNLI